MKRCIILKTKLYAPHKLLTRARQAIIAQKMVFPLLFNEKLLDGKYQKKFHINVTEFEFNFNMKTS